MEIVGWVFVGILALIVVAALAMGIMSLPDAAATSRFGTCSTRHAARKAAWRST
ncbi:hypothetical protein I552_4754 [Mycobacterium xenopi 3993]|nr:hypothetical protein I552_4754 [Mycobacterium xenopi 3993]